MSKLEDFLNAQEEQEIVEAIHIAEKNTSGEIRVHIEEHSDKLPLERAQEVFFELQMNETQERNGVLFYVCVADKKFAIIGDEGIDKVVASDFWNATKEVVISNFKNKAFKKGLVDGIIKAGESLKVHFPFQSDDTNELANEISRG